MSKNKYSGKSISDIMDMSIDEFLSLSASQLRQATQRLASAANKRLKRIEQSSTLSPAAIEALESGGKFSTKNKNLVELQVEFRRVSNFLQSPSSTVTGAKKLEEEARKSLKDIYGIGIDKEQFRQIVTDYRKLINASPEVAARALKYKVLKETRMELDEPTLTTDDIAQRINEALGRYYMPGGMQYDGVSEYFGFE